MAADEETHNGSQQKENKEEKNKLSKRDVKGDAAPIQRRWSPSEEYFRGPEQFKQFPFTDK